MPSIAETVAASVTMTTTARTKYALRQRLHLRIFVYFSAVQVNTSVGWLTD